ncbi:hypothetical protein DPMN_088216 [Dreissena polymorpha]|uniref:Uncharacterized protein n=1 Tax=Dreissena polymorpha TaxID=45954 RepID=A0A9D4KVS1_DREPO|nr:hypothetical protein DPMN_088216 [Dreissena polymorpha]
MQNPLMNERNVDRTKQELSEDSALDYSNALIISSRTCRCVSERIEGRGVRFPKSIPIKAIHHTDFESAESRCKGAGRVRETAIDIVLVLANIRPEFNHFIRFIQDHSSRKVARKGSRYVAATR